MVMSNTWEEETRKYLAQIQTELNDAIKQFNEARAKVDTLTREAEAYELALASRLKRTGRPESLRQDMRAILIQQKNHKDRLKVIAEHNDGLLRVSVAADTLYHYQIVKSKSRMQAYRIVYGLMLKMVEDGKFVKSGAAEFRLVGAQPKFPVN